MFRNGGDHHRMFISGRPRPLSVEAMYVVLVIIKFNVMVI